MTQEEVSIWCQEHRISAFIETSAKNSTNVINAFELAVRQWQKLEKSTERELRAHGDTIDLTKNINLTQNNRFCCIGSESNSSNVTRIENEEFQ